MVENIYTNEFVCPVCGKTCKSITGLRECLANDEKEVQKKILRREKEKETKLKEKIEYRAKLDKMREELKKHFSAFRESVDSYNKSVAFYHKEYGTDAIVVPTAQTSLEFKAQWDTANVAKKVAEDIIKRSRFMPYDKETKEADEFVSLLRELFGE